MSQPIRRNAPLAAAAVTLSLLASSCVGPFNTWHQVLHWNRSVTEEKWAAEGIFIGALIIPVYSLAFIADMVVFNSIEFWGGKNPVPPAPYTSGEGVTEPKMEVSTDPGPIEVTPVCTAD